MRYFITGGLGFIGLELIKLLSIHKETLSIYVFDCDNHGRRSLVPDAPNIHIEIGDVLDKQHLYNSLALSDADTIIHLAAVHYLPFCENNPNITYDTNFNATTSIVTWLNENTHSRVSHIIFTSTAAVYADSPLPIRETSKICPDSPYAISKFEAEKIMSKCRVRHSILRLFNVYGHLDPTPHLIPETIRQLRNSVSSISIGNLSTIRDYIHIRDTCDALIRVALFPSNYRNQILNVGTGVGTAGHHAVGMLQAYFNVERDLEFDEKRIRESDKKCLIADASRLRSEYGWEPLIDLATGLTDLVEKEL